MQNAKKIKVPCLTKQTLTKMALYHPLLLWVIAIFAVSLIFVPTTNKQSPQKETGSESTHPCCIVS